MSLFGNVDRAGPLKDKVVVGRDAKISSKRKNFDVFCNLGGDVRGNRVQKEQIMMSSRRREERRRYEGGISLSRYDRLSPRTVKRSWKRNDRNKTKTGTEVKSIQDRTAEE
eukprot:763927-Hanusia_phi.AAC.3